VIDHKVIEMIKHHEGVKTTPYRCPALLWTVGVGHVIDPSHARVLLAERKALPIHDYVLVGLLLVGLAHLCLSPSMLDSVISKILPFG